MDSPGAADTSGRAPRQRPVEPASRQVTTPAVQRYVRSLLDAAKPLTRKAALLRLLLLKRACDRWEEERQQEGARPADEFPAAYRLVVPANCSWADLRRQSPSLGTALNAAFRAVEEANPALAGLFSSMDFTDQEAFSPLTLVELFARLDTIRMYNAEVDENTFVTMCEELMQGAEEDTGHSEPDSRTPRQVARLLVEILQPQEGMSIYDGACGSGVLLLECSQYLKRLGRNHESLRLYGQEIDPESWALCRINLACHGIHGASIEKGDTLRTPRHLTGDGRALMTFDRVISHPPFKRKEWGFEEWSSGERFGRSEYGIPPKSCADLAFIEHFVSSLSRKGMLGLVAPQDLMFRGREEGEIRQRMLQDDLFEAVITLGHDAWSPTSTPACLLVVNRAKPRERRDRILLLDGAHESLKAGSRDDALDGLITFISSAFHAYEDQEPYCRVVSLEEVRRMGYTLNVRRYLQSDGEEPQADLAHEWQILRKLIAQRDEAEKKMAEQFSRLEHLPDES